jgi:hypothetical protein
MRKWLVLVAAASIGGAVAWHVRAESRVNVEEWQDLQRIGLIHKVNEELWGALEDHSAWNTELARYARDTTAIGASRLQRWGAPAPKLGPFHREAVHLLELTKQFYGAIAESNFRDARAIGERIQGRMRQFEDTWRDVQHRYE